MDIDEGWSGLGEYYYWALVETVRWEDEVLFILWLSFFRLFPMFDFFVLTFFCGGERKVHLSSYTHYLSRGGVSKF